MPAAEFKFVKYAERPKESEAKLDHDVDKLVYAPGLRSVLCCGRTVHAFALRSHTVERSMQKLDTTVLSCIHLPSLSSIFISTTTCKVQSYDDSWFKLQREFLTEDPQLCFIAPKPFDYRRGTPTPVPTRLLSADTTGNLFEWDLTGRLSGLVKPMHEKIVATDWVTALLVPEGSLGTLVTSSLDTSVKLWDRRTMWDDGAVPVRTVDVHTRPVTGLLDLPRLDMCLSFGNDGVQVWSPGTASSVMQKLEGHDRPIVNVFQGKTWEELITVDRGGNIIVWDARFFNKLQHLEDPTIIEDDIITDACYDPGRQAILTTRKHIRSVTMNVRGRISSDKAGVSTHAGPVSIVGFCAYSLHIMTVAGPECTYWRCSDGGTEAVITGLAGKTFPFIEAHKAGVPDSLAKDEITAMVICTENKPLPDGQPNADVVFASSGGEIAVHDTYEGKRLWTMPVFPEERLVFLKQIPHSGGLRFCCGVADGRLAIFHSAQTVPAAGGGLVGTKIVDYCWGMEEKTVGHVVYDEKLRLLAVMPTEASTIRVWDLDPKGEDPSEAVVATIREDGSEMESEAGGMHRSSSPPLPVAGAHFTTFAFCGTGTAGGGKTVSLEKMDQVGLDKWGMKLDFEAMYGSDLEPEPEPEPAVGAEDGEDGDGIPEPAVTVEVGWLVAADSVHHLHAYRVDTWEKMFSWCSLSFVDKGLGRHPVGCLTCLGTVIGPGVAVDSETAGDVEVDCDEEYECVLAMDDVAEGSIVLWNLTALCLRWRATGEDGFVADDNYIVRKQPILDEFVTTIERLHHPALENDYLVCGSFDGKCKVTMASSGDLVGQLVTDGDDAWGFMDQEPGLEPHRPNIDDDGEDEEARERRQADEVFAELEGASPFYSLMVQSTDLTKRVQPEYVEQLERMTKDPQVKAHLNTLRRASAGPGKTKQQEEEEKCALDDEVERIRAAVAAAQAAEALPVVELTEIDKIRARLAKNKKSKDRDSLMVENRSRSRLGVVETPPPVLEGDDEENVEYDDPFK